MPLEAFTEYLKSYNLPDHISVNLVYVCILTVRYFWRVDERSHFVYDINSHENTLSNLEKYLTFNFLCPFEGKRVNSSFVPPQYTGTISIFRLWTKPAMETWGEYSWRSFPLIFPEKDLLRQTLTLWFPLWPWKMTALWNLFNLSGKTRGNRAVFLFFLTKFRINTLDVLHSLPAFPLQLGKVLWKMVVLMVFITQIIIFPIFDKLLISSYLYDSISSH